MAVPEMTTSGAAWFRAHISEIIDRVAFGDECVLLKRNKRVRAIILPLHSTAHLDDRLMRFIAEDKALASLEEDERSGYRGMGDITANDEG